MVVFAASSSVISWMRSGCVVKAVAGAGGCVEVEVEAETEVLGMGLGLGVEAKSLNANVLSSSSCPSPSSVVFDFALTSIKSSSIADRSLARSASWIPSSLWLVGEREREGERRSERRML